MTLASSDSTLAFAARDQITPGAGTASQFVPNGIHYTNFVVQGLENVIGVATITASAPGFASVDFDVTIGEPRFRVLELASGMATIDPDDNFFIQTGKPNGGSWTTLNVRTGGPGLTASVTSSDPAGPSW